jgi:16S rRNA (guanine966-N2)-methyltransferase
MDLDGVSVLDLYAGSGALGLEAVSRGAARAVLVDSARLAARAAGTNAAALGLPARVIVARAAQAASIRQPEAPFALVFLDPPYETGDTEVETVLNALGEAGNLAPGAIIVLERAAGASPPAPPLGWMWERAKTYGDTVVHIACPDGTR